jgi:hypothetical protein
MAIEKLGILVSHPAFADLRTHQYKVVVLKTDGTVGLPLTAVTAIPYGILQNAPNIGEEAVVAPIGCGGISKAWAATSLARSIIVALQWVDDVGDSGKVIAAATTQFPLGMCVYPSDAEDDLCSVLLTPIHKALTEDLP